MRNARSISHVLLSYKSLRIHVAKLSVGELVQHNKGNRARCQILHIDMMSPHVPYRKHIYGPCYVPVDIDGGSALHRRVSWLNLRSQRQPIGTGIGTLPRAEHRKSTPREA
jgi:hypothetical protein